MHNLWLFFISFNKLTFYPTVMQMLPHIKKILLFGVFFSLFSSCAYSQKTGKNKNIANSKAQNSKKKKEKAKVKKRPFDQALPIPKPTSELERAQEIPKDLISDSLETSADIISYFINEANSKKYFSFPDKKSNKRISISLDSMVFKIKEYIEAFKDNNESYINPGDSIFFKDERITAVYRSIVGENKKYYLNRNRDTIKNILASVELLPPSKEKIELFLRYADLNIYNDSYYTDVLVFIDSAKAKADMIRNFYEKGKAYNYIGDFATYYHIEDEALRFYYSAADLIQNSNIAEVLKNNEQGNFYNSLARVFSGLNAPDAQNSALGYYNYARSYFILAHNFSDADLSELSSISCFYYLMVDLPLDYSINLSGDVEEYELDKLQALKQFYITYQNRSNSYSEFGYKLFDNIATRMRQEGEYKAAIFYYIKAFINAAHEHSFWNLYRALGNISHAYAILGEKNEADSYVELRTNFYKSDNPKGSYYYYSILGHAANLFNQNQYDSAIFYLNKLQFDTGLENYYYPPYYAEFIGKVYDKKYHSFDSLRIYSDSVNYYKVLFLQSELSSWIYYARLLRTDNDSSFNKFAAEKDTEIRFSIQQINSLRNEKNSLINVNATLSRQAISLANLNKNLLSTITGNKKTIKETKQLADHFDWLAKDSKGKAAAYLSALREAQDSLATLNQTTLELRMQIETQKASISDLAKQKDKLRRNIQNALLIGGSLLSVAILFSVWLGKRIGKQKGENKLLQSTINNNKIEAERIAKENDENNYKLKLEKAHAEMKLSAILATNHDIDKFIPTLPEYIKETTPETMPTFITVVEKFKEYYLFTKGKSSSLTNTVKDEVQIAKASSEIFLYMFRSKTKPTIYTNFSSDTEIENLLVPKHMISEFVANSIKHGAIDMAQITVNILISRVSNGYRFIIEDDGIGFDTLDLQNKPKDKGINLILTQVKDFNETSEQYEILFNERDIINNPAKVGVIVEFKLLKK